MLNLDTHHLQTRVQAGEARISIQPSSELTTDHLGCGIAVAAYDPVRRVGGLLHALLPNSALDEAKAASLPSIFVDTGLRHFLETFKKMKVDVKNLEFKIAGGSDLLENNSEISIGQENIAAAHAILEEENLNLKNEVTGGNIPLNMALNLTSGEVTVSLNGYEDIIL